MSALLVLLLIGQGLAPLRKTDLVRLLSGSALSPAELAQLVSRNCLTFDPTDRDRTDFRRLGADRAMLAAVDECVRRAAAARRPVTPRPATPALAPPPPVGQPHRAMPVPRDPPPAPAVRISAERSGFVAGGGQRGAAGARLSRALVFEVRDSTGAPISGQAVTFTGINARIDPGTVTTDAAGQARAAVTLGERVGSATVIAAVGVVEKQVAFKIAAGPAAQLVLACGAASFTSGGRFAMRPDSVVVLRVVAQDGFANGTPLLGLRAAVADARVFRVLSVTQDTLSGSVTLKPDQAGTTSLAVIANGLRQYFTVTVPPRVAPGLIDCH